MSDALLKKFRKAKQGSSQQKEMVRRARSTIQRAKITGETPHPTLKTIISEYKPETKAQLKDKASSARAGALTMVGGPLLKGAAKGIQLGRAALAGLPRGMTAVKGGFKVGEKVYKSKGAATKALNKAKTIVKPPKVAPKVPPSADRLSQAAGAGRRPNPIVRQMQRQQNKPSIYSGRARVPSARSAVVPAATGIAAVAATTGGRKANDKAVSTKNKLAKVASPPNKKVVASRPNKKAVDNSAMMYDANLQQPVYDIGMGSGTSKTPKKVVSSRGRGKSRGSTGGESMGEYLKDLQQRNTKVKTPFGIIDVDSTDEGMAFEEFDQKSGGQVKKRRMGGMVKKGYGKALRGY